MNSPQDFRFRSASSPDILEGSPIPASSNLSSSHFHQITTSYSYHHDQQHQQPTSYFPSAQTSPRPRSTTVIGYQRVPDNVPDPISSLAGRTTPFFFKQPRNLHDTLISDSIWSPTSPDTSRSAPWSSPDTSFEEDGSPVKPRSRSVYFSPGLPSIPRISVSQLEDQVNSLNHSLQSLMMRVGDLERGKASQEEEIALLRSSLNSYFEGGQSSMAPGYGLQASPFAYPVPLASPYAPPQTYHPQLFGSVIQRSTTPIQSSSSTSKLQALAKPFSTSSPPPYQSPGTPVQQLASVTETDQFLPLPTQQSTSAHLDRTRSFDSRGPSPSGSGSPIGSRRRSRVNNGDHYARMRGLSFSAIAPVVAQANWLAQQNGPSEPFNYRTLMDQDADIDPDIFIRRILSHNDQQCSLFLQQRLKAATDDLRIAICDAVSRALLPLSTSKFGNFLVSRALEHGGPAVALDYSEQLAGHFYTLSTDQFGCHVVQKALDCGDHTTREHVIDELMPYPATLTQRHAGHVWSRLLAVPNPKSFFQRLSEAAEGMWVDIAKDETGSLIVQSVLECWPWDDASKSNLALECFEGLLELASCQWGNFVAMHFIEHRGSRWQRKILENAARLATDTFGAKAVDRAIRCSSFNSSNIPPSLISDFIDSICQSPPDGFVSPSSTLGLTLHFIIFLFGVRVEVLHLP